MPGIYVRTLSHFDWLDQEKESLLTVPGSYWLCHKKNIYKFIFRYHRTVKNTVQFSYGRELLKVIRRIIKCHPTQGQQFGTQHLLVTYNCTSWTRQDKMFALMKFQQRNNAAAFSHAFVLTIRTFPSSEHSLFNLKYPIVKEADAGTTFKDLNVSLDTEEKIISNGVSATDKVSSRKGTICQTKKMDEIANYDTIENVFSKATIDSNFQDNSSRESAVFGENLDEKIESATTTADVHFVDKHNIEFHNDVQENMSINCSTETYEGNVEQYSIDCDTNNLQEQSLGTKKTGEMEIEKACGMKEGEETELAIIPKQNQQTQDIQKYKISSSLKPSLTGMMKGSVSESPLSNKFNFDENSMEKNDTFTINNKDNLNVNKETRSGNIDTDPSNVSHQYFTEKEIEGTKSNLIIDQSVQMNLQTEMKNINKDCVPKMIKESNKSVQTKQEDRCNETTNLKFQENDRQHTRTSMNIDDKQSESNMHGKSHKTSKKRRESEKKTIPDKRSSNITDLVMEGLMFTIRQDQDSVAVIEQKTKLEMDEVLENSEKVETKAGEKCLLNSSLLRLENLVTMIDSPRSKDGQHKNRHAISNSANLSPFNIFPSDTVYSVNINDLDTGTDRLSVSNYDNPNAIKHLNPYQSRWQHQRVPSNIKNNNSSANGISVERREQLMEWQGSDHEQGKKHLNDTQEKQELIPEISPKKINAGLQNTNSPMINRNIEEIDKHDKSTEGHYNSPLSNSSLNSSKMSTKTISVVSTESSLIELSRQEANIPRIVSNKAITIEQIPSALQKVLRHTCRARKFSSTISSGTLQQNEEKVQHVAGDTIPEADVLLKDKCTGSNVDNNSSIKFTIDSEKVGSSNARAEKSCVTIDKDVSETNRDTRVKNLVRKTATPRRDYLRSYSSRHSSARKLQDITEEFYYDLVHVHHKDNAIRQRCLRQKQRSLNNLDDIKSGKVRIEMLKFIQDITVGVRVVVRRLNMDNKPNLLEKNSNLT